MSLDNIEIHHRLQGTWHMPQTGDHQTTVTLHHNGSLHMTIAARSAKERGRQLLAGDQVSGNWHITSEMRSRGGSVLSSSSSSVGSSFWPASLPRESRSGKQNGPFVVLSVQDLPKAIANVRIFGFRADVANWAVSLEELRGGYHLRIVDLSNYEKSIDLELGNGRVQTWHRIKRGS